MKKRLSHPSLRKCALCAIKHLRAHRHRYALRVFGTFAVVRMFLLFFGVTNTISYAQQDGLGCTDVAAYNYDATVSEDDGSCLYFDIKIHIRGDGYFIIQNPDNEGPIMYTRNNLFHINTQGKLITSEGYQLLQDITFPQPIDIHDIQITMDGVVTVSGQNIGTILLARFISPEGLTPVESGYYIESPESGAPEQGNPLYNNFGIIDSQLMPKMSGFNFQIIINGTGYFKIQHLDGNYLYTKNTTFYLNEQNKLVTVEGLLLLPEFTFPEIIDINTIQITMDGVVTVDNQNIGTIQLTKFSNPDGLVSANVGSGYYVESRGSGVPQEGNPLYDGFGVIDSQFALRMTGFHFRLGIDGNGYFQIQHPDSSIIFAREGTFYLNDQHQLVTVEGLLLVPTITFPESITEVPEISSDGIITYDGQQLDQQIQIAKFINPAGLTLSNVGSGYYATSEQSGMPIVGIAGSNNFGAIVQDTGSSSILNTIHIGIHGNGYFQVQNADNTILYTRNNVFHLDNQGRLVTMEGYAVTPGITFPEPIDANNTQISMDGRVFSYNQDRGTIQLAKFTNPLGLADVGSGYYETTQESGLPQTSDPHTNGMGLLVSELSYQNTGFNFAMGISGNGYFQIQDPDGSIVYTRNNTFYLNSQNQLSTKEGLLLSPTITFPEGITEAPQISSDGVVTFSDQTTENIPLAVFTNPAGLVPTDLELGYYKDTYKSGQPVIGTPGSDSFGSLVLGVKSSPLILGIDVTINGGGYFQVLNYDGTILYTRNGNFLLNANGELVTSNGDIILPTITFPIGSLSSTRITNDGDIFVGEDTLVGNIPLSTFTDAAALSGSPIRSEYYMENDASGTPIIGRPGEGDNGTLSFRLKTTSSVPPTINLDSTPSCSQMTLTITGDGYFKVQNPNDEAILYTRNAIFQLDNQGRIVTPEGYILLPETTLPNAIDKNTLITLRGAVTEKIQGQQYGNIELTKFADPDLLYDIGDGYYSETEPQDDDPLILIRNAGNYTENQAGGAGGLPVVGMPGDQGFGILIYNNICGLSTNTSIMPNSDTTSDAISALRDNGYQLIGDDLIGNGDISLEATDGMIPVTLNIINNNIKVTLPQGLRLTQDNVNFAGTISPPIRTAIPSVDGKEVLASFKVGGDLQSIFITGGVATFNAPISNATPGDIISVYYSQNGGIDRNLQTVTSVIDYNGEPYVRFTANQFADFSILLASGGGTSGSIVINNDDVVTNSPDVNLTNSFPSINPIHMRFSNNNINRGNWQNYATTFPWTLSNNYGNKIVYAEFDADGDYNGDISITDSIVYGDGIILLASENNENTGGMVDTGNDQNNTGGMVDTGDDQNNTGGIVDTGTDNGNAQNPGGGNIGGGSAGGGGGAVIVTDPCASQDCSSSYYDKMCGACPEEVLEEALGTTGHSSINEKADIMNSTYSQELTNAYAWAFDNQITTIAKIENANLEGLLIRSHMAKMISEFSINILGMKPDESRSCAFGDMIQQTDEMKYYTILSCQLGIMGLNQDGTPAYSFNPENQVTREQFGTALSRVLYGAKYNSNIGIRYAAHLNALKKAGIMTKIDTPDQKELRGWVMLMMQRATEK